MSLNDVYNKSSCPYKIKEKIFEIFLKRNYFLEIQIIYLF